MWYNCVLPNSQALHTVLRKEERDWIPAKSGDSSEAVAGARSGGRGMNEDKLTRAETMIQSIRSTLAKLNSDKEDNRKQDYRKGDTLSDRIESLEKIIQAIIKILGRSTTNARIMTKIEMLQEKAIKRNINQSVTEYVERFKSQFCWEDYEI